MRLAADPLTTLSLLTLFGLVSPTTARAQSSLTNQTLFDTVSFLPEHYDAKVAQFREEPASNGVVIWLGDSITEGGSWGSLIGDSTTLNRGIGGDITYGVLHRLDEVIRHRPSKLFILIGINDIAKDIPEAVIADNCRKIVRRV
ncbi:MAG: GDSL-type esterase/lipase family protein, partial [Gemmatimonadaceae bacterium]